MLRAVIIFLAWGIFLTPVFGQKRIVVYPEKNTLCFGFKSGGRNVILEDGEVRYGDQKIADTLKGCFDAPKNLCALGKQTDLIFYPRKLYQRFKKTIPFGLVGVEVWQRRGKNRVKAVRCFPTREFGYPGDPYLIKVRDFWELHRLLTAIPYVANVRIQDEELLQVVKPYVRSCSTEDNTCLVYNSYSAVTKKLTYKSDPYIRGRDYIRTPRETIRNQGGDCEDLTGVLVSFLSNLKVDSYVLMTSDHAYAMACGINPDRLQEYIRESLVRSFSQSQKRNLPYGRMQSHYYGLQGGKPGTRIQWGFSAKGKYPFSFLVAEGKVSDIQLKSGRFRYLKECSRFNITEFDGSCEASGTGITMIIAYGIPLAGVPPLEKSRGNNTIQYTYRGIYNLSDINHVAVHYYKLNRDGQDTYCVVLEPTAGADGYPGFSRVKNQSSIAISPDTWEWFYLGKPLAIKQ